MVVKLDWKGTVTSQSLCPITWQDSHQALQSLFLSCHLLLLGPYRPRMLRQNPARPDGVLKKLEVLHPAPWTCEISYLHLQPPVVGEERNGRET